MTAIIVIIWALLAVLLSRTESFERPEDRLLRAGFIVLSVWLPLVALWGNWLLIGVWIATAVVFLAVVVLT